jgi:aromatic ring-cleaving dioxygenase
LFALEFILDVLVAHDALLAQVSTNPRAENGVRDEVSLDERHEGGVGGHDDAMM